MHLNASNLWQCLNAVGQQYLHFATVSSKLYQVTFTFFFVILLGNSHSDSLITATAKSCFMFTTSSQKLTFPVKHPTESDLEK